MADAEAIITVRIDGSEASADLQRLANTIESSVFGINVAVDTSSVAGDVENAVDTADASVTVDADASDVTTGIDAAVDAAASMVDIEADASSVTTGIDAAVDAASSMVSVEADTTAARSQLDADMSAAGTQSGNSFSSAFGVATAAVGAVVTTNLITGLIESEAQSQQTQNSIVAMYEAMGRGGSEALGVIESINDEFADSAFGTATFEDLAQSLTYVGVVGDDVVDIMSALEDEVQLAGTGAEGIDRAAAALQRMESEGRVTNDTLNQLSGSGVFIFERLAEEIGVAGDDYAATLRDMAAAGEISMADITAALQSEGGQWSEAARSAAENMETDLLTVLAGMQNTLQSAFTDALDLTVLSDMVGDLGTVLEPVISVLGETFMNVLSSLGPAIVPLIGVIGDLVVSLSPIIEVAATLSGTLLEALTPALVSLAEAITPVIEVVATLVEWIGDILGPVIEWLADNVLMPLIDIFGDLLLSSLETTIGAFEGIVEAGRAVGEFFQWLWEQTVELAVGLAEQFNSIVDNVTGAFTAIGDWIQTTVDWFAALPGQILGFLGDLGGRIWSALNLSGLASNILSTINDIQNWFSDLPGRVISGIGDLGSSIWSSLSSGFSSLMSNVQGIVDDIVQFFRDLPGRVTDAIGDLGGSIWDSVNPFSAEESAPMSAAAAAGTMARVAEHGTMTSGYAGGSASGSVVTTDGRSYHQPVNINLRSSSASPDLIARQIHRRLTRAASGSALSGAH